MAYSPIEESYMNGFVSSQFETPPEPVLLAENTGAMPTQQPMTDTGGGAAVGTRLKMPSGLNTPENMRQVGSEVIPAGAAIAKGAGQASVGMYGDIEGLGRMVLNYMGVDVNEKTKLPTTEEVKGFLDKYIPVDEKYATFEKMGELASPAGAYGLGKAAVKTVKATKNVPVGMSTQAVGEGVDQLGFYSAARQAVDAIQQPKGTGDQFLKQIEKTPGVKPDEIKWTGLDEFLKSKKSVTKAEVQEYLDKNRVEIKEVELGNPLTSAEQSEIKALRQKDRMTTSDRARFDMLSSKEDSGQSPKFSKYTLPGGENYREVLLTLPSKTMDRNSPEMIKAATEAYGEKSLPRLSDSQWQLISNKLQSTPEFKSSHFDQPNILAHLRVNDRVDADGKKVLFVEEVQSDWHQAGRKKGYSSDIGKQLEAINAERKTLMDEKLRYEKLAEPYVNQGKDAPPDVVEGWSIASNRLQSLQMKQDRLSTGVPDAPFKTTWSELAMKRAIQMASEGGYDRIAFTTGKTQAERFDLSKQIDNIQFNPTTNALFAEDKFGKTVIDETVSPNELDEYVGKEVAQKLLSENSIIARKKDGTPYLHEVSGVDLQVGGEGMKGFYDDILPKFLNKYAKKWDAKAGMTEIPVGKGKPTQYADFDEYSKAPAESNVPVHYIDITPKMRESVVTKGQPMFAVGGASAGAASQQEENK